MKKYLPLTIALALPFVIAFLGSSVTTPSIDSWYQSLKKPSFSPPNWIFGPVWTALFLLMGIASYLVWKKEKKIKTSLKLYGIQLGLNFFWSYLFFGLHRPDWSLFEIALLWFFILLTIKSFYKVRKEAGIFLIPYLLWVSFAAYLNYTIFLLNR